MQIMKHRWNRKGVAEREDDRYKVFFFLPCFSYPSLHSHMIALLCLFSLYLCNLMAYLSFLAFWYTSFCCIPIFLSCHRRYVTLPPLTYSIKLVLKTVISSFKQIYSTNDIHLFIDWLLILCVWQKLHALRSNDALQIICFLVLLFPSHTASFGFVLFGNYLLLPTELQCNKWVQNIDISAMDTILLEAVPKLFGEDVNQKIVRRISKVSVVESYLVELFT